MAIPVEDLDGGGGGDGGGYTPTYQSGDWGQITNFTGGVTAYRTVGFASQDSASIDLGGVYTVLSVSTDKVVLSNPALVNPAWNQITTATQYSSPALSTNGERWIGPFIVEADTTQQLLANFAGLNGLYKESTDKKGNTKQVAFPITCQLEITPVDVDDDPIGTAQLFGIVVEGNTDDRASRYASLWATPTFSGRMSVRARRLTPSDLTFKGSVVDEVKWRDLFGVSPVTVDNFGDVTTVHTRTYATNSALSVKERELNARVTRMLPRRVEADQFTTNLYPTDDLADIISALCLDPIIGARPVDEIDFDSIYDTMAEVEDYFGTVLARQFGYTFDDDNLSFEETLASVCQTGFSIAYRQGRVIRLSFERATEDSVLLFNHRNTIPDTQERTVRFGVLNDQDGVSLDWTDPVKDVQLTHRIPGDGSATNARTVEVQGVRSYQLAYWHDWRAWNRMQYQNVAVQLEATQEAGLVIRNDRVLISDINRPDRIDGEIVAQDGRILTLSEPAALDPAVSWTIFLQHIDATVEALGVSAGVDDYQVVLATAPRLPLATDEALALGTARYTIVGEGDPQSRAFLVAQREPQTNFTEALQAVNYTFLYYQNDQLVLWLPFDQATYADGGPYRRNGVAVGGPLIVTDVVWGSPVYLGNPTSSVTFPAFDSPASYTKSVWLKAGPSGSGGLLQSAGQAFELTDSHTLRAGHGSQTVESAFSYNWAMAAVTYDAETRLLSLFVNGLMVAQRDSVAPFTPGQLVAFAGYEARADDLRMWSRALTSTEVNALYRVLAGDARRSGGDLFVKIASNSSLVATLRTDQRLAAAMPAASSITANPAIGPVFAMQFGTAPAPAYLFNPATGAYEVYETDPIAPGTNNFERWE